MFKLNWLMALCFITIIITSVCVCVGSEQCCLLHGEPALPQAGGKESAWISSLVSLNVSCLCNPESS